MPVGARDGTPGRGTGGGASPSPGRRGSGGIQVSWRRRLEQFRGRHGQAPRPRRGNGAGPKEAEVWNRLVPLRRYAGDQRAWFSWLAGPLAAMWRARRGLPRRHRRGPERPGGRPRSGPPLLPPRCGPQEAGPAARGGAVERAPAARAAPPPPGGQGAFGRRPGGAPPPAGRAHQGGRGALRGLSGSRGWVCARLGVGSSPISGGGSRRLVVARAAGGGAMLAECS